MRLKVSFERPPVQGSFKGSFMGFLFSLLFVTSVVVIKILSILVLLAELL